ncbi:MAG: hypothetical protein WDN29_04465 [Methylovirgula sp.]
MNKQSKQNIKRCVRWVINKVGLDVTFAELQQTGTVDLRALPHVLPRILKLSGRHRARLTLAIIATLGATFVTLVIPHLLGVAVDQAHTLLSAGAGSYANARHALWVTATFLIAAATGAWPAHDDLELPMRVDWPEDRLRFAARILRKAAETEL